MLCKGMHHHRTDRSGVSERLPAYKPTGLGTAHRSGHATPTARIFKLAFLGLDLLTSLLDHSPTGTRRHMSGSRPTPDAVAAHLHFMNLVAGGIASTYNDIGVRR